MSAYIGPLGKLPAFPQYPPPRSHCRLTCCVRGGYQSIQQNHKPISNFVSASSGAKEARFVAMLVVMTLVFRCLGMAYAPAPSPAWPCPVPLGSGRPGSARPHIPSRPAWAAHNQPNCVYRHGRHQMNFCPSPRWFDCCRNVSF